MKIRNINDLQNYLDSDLAWRKKELTTLFHNIRTSRPHSLPVSLRSAVVLLYAHWEGFIKNAAEYYLNFIKYRGLNLDQLNINLLTLCLKQKLNEFNQTNKSTLHVTFVDFFQNQLSNTANIVLTDAIKTRSNLNSIILKEILTTIGIDPTSYELKSNLIDTQLLKYRNNIAHGNYVEFDQIEYTVLHQEILSMLDNFYTDIYNAALLHKYRK